LVLSHLVGAAPGVAPVSAPLALVALILLVATSRWLAGPAMRALLSGRSRPRDPAAA
jgi:hypothetical protein